MDTRVPTKPARQGALGAVSLFVGLLVALQAIALLISFRYGFDLTDEGFVLDLLHRGRAALFASSIHVFLHPIGILWGHRLLGYRILDFIVVTGSAIFCARSILLVVANREEQNSTIDRSSMSFVSVAALVFWAWRGRYAWKYPIIGYTSLAPTFALLSMSLLLRATLARSRREFNHLVWALAIMACLAFTCRPPGGIALWIVQLTLLFLLLSRHVSMDSRPTRWGLLLNYGLASVVFFLPFVAVMAGQLTSVVNRIAPAMRAMGHGTLFPVSGTQLWWLAYATMGWLCFSYLSSAVGRSSRWLLAVAIAACIVAATSIVATGVLITVTAAAIVSLVHVYRTASRDDLRNYAFFWSTCIGCAFAARFGSNANIFAHSTQMLPLLIAPILLLALVQSTRGGKRWLIFVLALIGCVCSVHSIATKQFFDKYRSGEWALLTAYSDESTLLQGIRMPPQLAHNVDALILALRKENFDFERDRLIAYPDLPGLISGAGAAAYGRSWMITRYPGAEELNLAYLESEAAPNIGKLYLLLAVPLPAKLQAFIRTNFISTPATSAQAIGTEDFHRRDMMPYRLQLSGPFVQRER